MCFMHASISPFFISALDMSRCVIASFCLAASVILAIISSICFIWASLHKFWLADRRGGQGGNGDKSRQKRCFEHSGLLQGLDRLQDSGTHAVENCRHIRKLFSGKNAGSRSTQRRRRRDNWAASMSVRGTKRTLAITQPMSASDPKRTFATMLSKAAPRRPAPRLSRARTLSRRLRMRPPGA